MSVSAKIVTLRDRIANAIVANYEYGEGVSVRAVGETHRDQGTSHSQGEYIIDLTLVEDGEEFSAQCEILFAPGSDEVYEAFVMNNDIGGVVGETVVDNPELISHWMKSAKAA